MKFLNNLTREQRRTVNEVGVLVVIALLAVVYFMMSSGPSTPPPPLINEPTERSFETDFNLDALETVTQTKDNRPNLESETGKSNPFTY